MGSVIAIILILILTLIIFKTSLKHEKFDQPNELKPYLGYWIWFSDDKLRKEILNINYGGDNKFLRLTKVTTIRKWFPPVHTGGSPLVAPPERYTETGPMYRVIQLTPTEILLTSIEPTYAELPFHIKLLDNNKYIEMNNKKYISSTKLDPSMLKF